MKLTGIGHLLYPFGGGSVASVPIGPGGVTAQTVYFCVRFPSGYRYYFVFAQDDDVPILLDHPFRDYYSQTVEVFWDTHTGGGGVYLDISAIPGFEPFGDVTARIHIPEVIYDEIIAAFTSAPPAGMKQQEGAVEPQSGAVAITTEVNFVASGMFDLFQFFLDSTPTGVSGLDPPVLAETSGTIEFILISTVEGLQYKIDLEHMSPVPPEDPITVGTMVWNETLFRTMSVPTYDFYYVPGGDLAMTFIHPKFCFMREWIPWPPEWVAAIHEFSTTSRSIGSR